MGNVIANADNAVMATLGKAGRALNNAGYDIADGAVGLYRLAVDGEVRSQALNAVGNALSHPVDTAQNLYQAGGDHLKTASYGQMAEDGLRVVASGLATGGVGRGAAAAGSLAGDAAVATGKWVAPKAAEQALARSGGIAYAVPRDGKVGGAGIATESAAKSEVGRLSTSLCQRVLLHIRRRLLDRQVRPTSSMV